LNGIRFRIWTFRTTPLGAEPQNPALAAAAEGRLTGVGKWLKQCKIDKLPHLVNVFMGEMALVGPAPEIPGVAPVPAGDQGAILRLRPGITGAAALAYRCQDEILSRVPNPEAYYIQNILPNKVRINLEYAARATVWTNFKLILAAMRLLPPPVRVSRPGDLRAFDRVSLATPVRLAAGSLPAKAGSSVNISQGGILVRTRCSFPVNSRCELVLGRDENGGNALTAKGTIIRSDEQGTVVRFLKPMKFINYMIVKPKHGNRRQDR
jgi:hypothetical protein